MAQVCKHFIEFLDNQKVEKRRMYKAEFEEYVKSSIDTVLKDAKEQRQTRNEAVSKLQDKIKSLGLRQKEAQPLM